MVMNFYACKWSLTDARRRRDNDSKTKSCPPMLYELRITRAQKLASALGFSKITQLSRLALGGWFLWADTIWCYEQSLITPTYWSNDACSTYNLYTSPTWWVRFCYWQSRQFHDLLLIARTSRAFRYFCWVIFRSCDHR